MILVQEANEIAYACAFGCQKTHYTIETIKGIYKFSKRYTKKDIVRFFKAKNKEIDKDYTITPETLLSPKTTVDLVLKAMISKLYTVTVGNKYRIDSIRLILCPTDKSNFRYSVASIPGPKGVGYKAGRGEKPHYLDYVREQMIANYDATVVSGIEADDMLGILASPNVVLSHTDKDMNMIEGWHYNPTTASSYFIEEGLGTVEIINNKVVGRGIKWFYHQLLVGDSTDNIPGCFNKDKLYQRGNPRITDKVAYELLKSTTDECGCFERVRDAYIYTYKEEWKEALLEIANLVWICRKADETGADYIINNRFYRL